MVIQVEERKGYQRSVKDQNKRKWLYVKILKANKDRNG